MSIEIGRRDFMRLGALSLISAASAIASPQIWRKGFEWATEVEGSNTLQKVRTNAEHGFLETRHPHRPPFIVLPDGHAAYLQYICLNDSFFTGPEGIMHRAYTDVFHSVDNPPKIGDAFAAHVQYAVDALRRSGIEGDELLDHAVHLAWYSFAYVYSPYPREEYLKRYFGILQEQIKPKETPMYYRFPTVYQKDPRLCFSRNDVYARCRGGDRAVHVANFGYLAHMIQYAMYYQLPDVDGIPRIAKLPLLFGTPEGKAYRFVGIAQIAWELHETLAYLRGNGPTDLQGNRVVTGFFDSFVFSDFAANALGVDVALTLRPGNISYTTIQQCIDRLNSDEVSGVFEPEPIP